MRFTLAHFLLILNSSVACDLDFDSIYFFPVLDCVFYFHLVVAAAIATNVSEKLKELNDEE